MTVPELTRKLTETQVTALTIWAEARSEGIAGMVAVATVIHNRYHDPHTRYGSTIRDVCLKKWAFSCWWEKGANNAELQRMIERFAGLKALPESFLNAMSITEGIIAADTAKHYMTEELFENKPPKWAVNLVPSGALGHHVFFEGVDD